MFRNTFAEINLDHFAHNLKTLWALTPPNSFFCPMIKSNAYGHGDIEMGKIIEKEQVQNIGVALLEEGIALREAGIQRANILIFGPFSGGAKEAQEFKLTPVVSHLDQLKELANNVTGGPLAIHLKLNSGMNRLGFDEESFAEIEQVLQQNPSLELGGLCTHLAIAEDSLTKGYTEYQLKKFSKFIKRLGSTGIEIHVFNSAGLIAQSISRENQNWGSRPGISLYGVKPQLMGLEGKILSQWKAIELKPVMTLKSEIINFHRLSKGDRVSYGGTWVAPRKSVIGVVPIGYADGYHRLFSNRGKLLFRGQRVSVVGRVCMDYILADLTEVLGDQLGTIGEEVVLFGRQGENEIAVTELAQLAETISYELLSGMGRRVPRKFV